MTIGQVPVEVWVELTTKDPSEVQLSDIDGLPAKASKAATVVTAAGAAPTPQPSTLVAVSVPVMVGAVVSLTLTIV